MLGIILVSVLVGYCHSSPDNRTKQNQIMSNVQNPEADLEKRRQLFDLFFNFLCSLHMIDSSNWKLEKKDNDWYIHHGRGIIRRVAMQGGSDNKVQKGFLFARTDDGIWYRFDNTSSRFRDYLTTLPLFYHDKKLLVCDGLWWYILTKNRYHKKIVNKVVASSKDKLTVEDEDGNRFNFYDGLHMDRFKKYVMRLPLVGTSKHLRCIVKELSNVTRPTEALRKIIAEKDSMLPSDNFLMEHQGIWYIKRKGRCLRIVIEGMSLNMTQNPLYGQTEDGKWHVFYYPCDRFGRYLSKIPKQCDFGYFLFDGQHWYINDQPDKYRQIIMQSSHFNKAIAAATDYVRLSRFREFRVKQSLEKWPVISSELKVHEENIKIYQNSSYSNKPPNASLTNNVVLKKKLSWIKKIVNFFSRL